MKKYFLLAALLLIYCLHSFCQHNESRRKDSLIIDSLRSILPSLKDSARIDCLNSLSEKCIFFKRSYSSEDSKRGGDSMYKYAQMANKEATRINYKYGIATSLLNLVSSYRVRGPMDSTHKRAIKDSILINYTRQALLLAKEIQNDELSGRVYYELGDPEKNEIENYKQSIYYYQQAGNQKMELEVTTYFVWELMGNGNYDQGIEYGEKCIQLSKQIIPSNSWEHELVEDALVNMGDIYEAGGDYETALDYFHQADKYVKTKSGWEIDIKFCELYYLMGQYDAALHSWKNWKKNYDTYYFGHKAYGNTLLGKIYIKTGEYDKAIEMFNLSLNTFKKDEKYDTIMAWGLIKPSLFMGEAYAKKNNYKTALIYVKQGLYFAKLKDDKPDLVQGYEIISRIYHQLGNNDSAYISLLKYIGLKDSIQNKQFIWRLNNYKKAAEDAKKEAKIGILNRDNQIKHQQLKQEATFRNFLIAVFIAIAFAGLYIFRSINLKRKNEKLQQEQKEQEWKVKHLESENKHVELQRHSAELEMQALRSQMNPHFIFNSLSSINHFILKNESKTASNYLTRFSRLIRMVLINSQKPLIALEDELQMLGLYLEMERLRFKNSFDYGITFLNAIDSDNVFIPPLLLQPFCENAIWHGLMNKEGQGRLDIELSMHDNILNCTITDNGIGREKAGDIKNKLVDKEKSMGLKITADRLALLNREKGAYTFYEIEDLKDENGRAAGTKVNLKISYEESLEELK